MANEPIVSEKTLKELVRLGQTVGDPKTVPGGVPYVILPADCKVESLGHLIYNDYAERPHRKNADVKVLDAASFVEYFQLFSDENSRVFADETKAQMLAVLDYHCAGNNAPRWGQHRISLTLRKSEEWKVWTAKNRQKQTQIEFAEFVEDNTPDILVPTAATMLELAREMQAKTDVDYSSGIRLSNGQVQLTYNEQVKGTYGSGKVEIPEAFTIGIPVFVGTPRVSIKARLRYRLVSGKLSIWFDLLRHDVVERNGFLDVLQGIKDGLKTGIINGSPT